MLTSADKKTLKGIANTLETKYQLGKSGITDASVDMFDKALKLLRKKLAVDTRYPDIKVLVKWMQFNLKKQPWILRQDY